MSPLLEPQNPASTRITPTLLHVYVIAFKISFETVLGLKKKKTETAELYYTASFLGIENYCLKGDSAKSQFLSEKKINK